MAKYLIFEELLNNENIVFEKEFPLKKLFPNSNKFKQKHRIDYVIIFYDNLLFIEIEGGIFTKGRHTRGKGFWNDILKYNAVIFAGYPIIRYPAILIKKHPVQVVEQIKKYCHGELSPEDLNQFMNKHKIKN